MANMPVPRAESSATRSIKPQAAPVRLTRNEAIALFVSALVGAMGSLVGQYVPGVPHRLIVTATAGAAGGLIACAAGRVIWQRWSQPYRECAATVDTFAKKSPNFGANAYQPFTLKMDSVAVRHALIRVPNDLPSELTRLSATVTLADEGSDEVSMFNVEARPADALEASEQLASVHESVSNWLRDATHWIPAAEKLFTQEFIGISRLMIDPLQFSRPGAQFEETAPMSYTLRRLAHPDSFDITIGIEITAQKTGHLVLKGEAVSPIICPTIKAVLSTEEPMVYRLTRPELQLRDAGGSVFWHREIPAPTVS